MSATLRELGERVERAVLEGLGRAASRVQERKPLSADLLESDEAFLAVFDAAGATAEDVDVRFDDGTVFVSVDRFREFHEGFDLRVPGRGQSLDGSVALPEDAAVAPDRAEATVTPDGVLQVRIPKLDRRGDDIGVAEESGPASVDDGPVDVTPDDEDEDEGEGEHGTHASQETGDDHDHADDHDDVSVKADEDAEDGDAAGDASPDHDDR